MPGVAASPGTWLLDAAAVLRVQAAVLAQAQIATAAAAFASELAELFGAMRVCLGLSEGSSVVIAAISGQADFPEDETGGAED